MQNLLKEINKSNVYIEIFIFLLILDKHTAYVIPFSFYMNCLFADWNSCIITITILQKNGALVHNIKRNSKWFCS